MPHLKMVVVGFNLKKILIERKSIVRGQIKINTKMNITNVKKEDIKLTAGKDVINFNFEFMISYINVEDNTNPIADIIFEGNVLYLTDPKDTKKILDDWKKNKIEEDTKLKVLNTILAKCNIKALVLEEDMGLPSHLPLPRLSGKEKDQEKEEKKK